MKTSLYSLTLAVAFALVARAASPEATTDAALPVREAIATPEDSLFTESSDLFAEPDAGEYSVPDPLGGPIQPLGDTTADQREPMRRRWDVQFRLRIAATYDDNIFIQARDAKGDMISHVAAGFTLVLGDTSLEASYLSLRYDADAVFFLSRTDLNAVNQDAMLRGQWKRGSLTLGGFCQYLDLTSADNEVGGRVNRKVYSGGANATWKWSPKTALEFEVEGRKSNYATQINTTELLARSWFEYEYSQLTEVAVGLTAGAVEVDRSGRQTYAQLLGRVKYNAASKLKAQFQTGVEMREYARGGSTVTPVFNLGAVYTPYDLLELRLDGYRLVQPSPSTADTNTVVTGLRAGLTYRFLRRYTASLSGGFEQSEYIADSNNAGHSRSDDYFFVRGGLQYAFDEHWRLGAFYEFRRNASSQSDHSFQNNQTGLEMALSF